MDAVSGRLSTVRQMEKLIYFILLPTLLCLFIGQFTRFINRKFSDVNQHKNTCNKTDHIFQTSRMEIGKNDLSSIVFCPIYKSDKNCPINKNKKRMQ